MADKTKHTWLDTFTMLVSGLVLIAFTVLSGYLNQVYAVVHGEDVRYHVSLPILALLAGVFAEVIFMSNVNRLTRWLTGLLVTVGFGAVMLASYLAVVGVAFEKYPSFPVPLIYVLAAFPDGFMVIGATVLLALRVRRTKLRESTVEVTKASTTSRWRRLADAATSRVEAALDVPTQSSVSAATEVHGGSVEPAVEPSADARGDSVKSPTEVRRPSAKPSTEARRPSAKPAAKSSVDPSVEPFIPAAEKMQAAGIVARKGATEIAAVIAAIAGGATDNGVKQSGLASASTAAKVRAAWEQVDQERELISA